MPDYLSVENWAGQELPDWQANASPAGPTSSRARLVVFPPGGSWAEAASGAYDGHWQRLGERLVAAGQQDAILRFAHEFNEFFHDYQVTRRTPDRS